MSLKAVVMAGGKGTRLRPITYSIPKPLVPIAGKPCIGYILDSYYTAGINDVIITTGYKFESLINGVLEFKQDDQNILFSVEREPAGTAGSVGLISKFIDDTFVVGSGDTLSDLDVSDVVKFHKEMNSKITMALTTVDDPSQFGIVELKNNKVVRFLEKPDPNQTFSKLINAGLYVIEPEILKHIPVDSPYDFARDLFPKLLDMGIDIYGYHAKGIWLDTGRPNDMIKANQLMTAKYGMEVSGNGIKGTVIIKTPHSKFSSAYIEGPTFIGENVRIGKNSKIIRSAIYDNVEIGNDVQITDSILMDSDRVMDGSRVFKSVIMKQTEIGSECEIEESVLAPKLQLQIKSRVYNVSLSSEILPEDVF